MFLVKECPGKPCLSDSTIIKHWLTNEEITRQPKFVIETATVLLLESVHEKLTKKEDLLVTPSGIIECVSAKDESEVVPGGIGERPQLVRAKSLENQMLNQSGYGPKGKHITLYMCFVY